jgi:hypothetical protein
MPGCADIAIPPSIALPAMLVRPGFLLVKSRNLSHGVAISISGIAAVLTCRTPSGVYDSTTALFAEYPVLFDGLVEGSVER